MFDPIPKNVKNLWDEWKIRGVILCSLLLQTFLVLFAPYRKVTANKLMMLLIWSSYLLADTAANYAVGLISDSDDQKANPSAPENTDLLAFWPPFLLLHLGGQDTITAFSLEDNELWLRHLLGFVSQAAAAVYVFLLSLPRNRVFIPAILMFAAGVIKYFERTRDLYLASLDRFRDSMLEEPDPGPNYAKLMEELASKKEAKLPTRIITIPEPDKRLKDTGIAMTELEDLQVVHFAYKYFNIFKGLIVDIIFSFRERDESRAFFNKLKDEIDALKIIEVELNFIYEVFYTKVEVLHSGLGYFLRLVASGSVVTALAIFYFRAKKDVFDEIDVAITYTLFLGALTLDTVSFFMFLRSDWTLAVLSNTENNGPKLKKFKSLAVSALGWLLVFRRPRWQKCHSQHPHKVQHEVLATPVLLRRWSGGVSGHNLIRYCLERRPCKVYLVKNCFRLTAEKFFRYLNRATDKVQVHRAIHLIRSPRVDKILKDIAKAYEKIIQFLHIGKLMAVLGYILSKFIHAVHLIAKGIIDILALTDLVDEIVYVSNEPLPKELWKFIFEEIKRKSQFADEEEVAKRIYSAKGDWVLLDLDPKGLRFNNLLSYISDVAYDESLLTWHIATELLYNNDDDTSDDPNELTKKKQYISREFSKLLSDYMLFLLVMRPTMMSAVAGIGKIRYRDTCAEAKRFFGRKNLTEKEACKRILEVNTYAKPVTVKGDRSKSVLFDASMLAQELNKQLKKGEEKWEVVSKVWVELLSYAASHCSARTHAQQVSKGGELITFVWLLMAHFGLGEQFQINKGQGRAKLIVGK